MANKEHREILKQGVEVWNKWRRDNPDVRPDLAGAAFIDADLREADFKGADLRDADLRGANLFRANFFRAKLAAANLEGADISEAYFWDAHLGEANLKDTNLEMAEFSIAHLLGANLTGATLINAYLTGANLDKTVVEGANLDGARLGHTSFGDIDLSATLNLDKVKHFSPSSIGIDTLYKSGGRIPVEFLRGCGIPEDFITLIPSLIGALEPIQFYSCFISYSTKDEEFARRLHSRMRDEKLRVWFAPEDMKGGELLHEQIEQAIQLHDRLLVVLSEESMASEWVKREIRNARRAEVREKRRKLFPIRLVDFGAIENWKGFEGDGAEDLAFELGKFYIPNFSHWKDHDAFEKEFERLLRDLRSEEGK